MKIREMGLSMIELPDLSLFRTLVEAGGVSAAAHTLIPRRPP